MTSLHWNRPICTPGLLLGADIPCFCSREKSTARKDGTEKISTSVSALYMTFELQGWTALFDLVDIVGPKV